MGEATIMTRKDIMKSCRKAVGRIGLALAAAFALPQIITTLLADRLLAIAPGCLDNNWVMLGVSVLPLYLVGMPLGLWIMWKMPQARPTEHRFPGFMGLVTFFAATFTFFLVFQMGTVLLVEGLGRIFRRDFWGILPDFSGGPFIASLVIMGILGPLMEELFFRGLVLRRLLPYGRGFAILLSAAAFGLFHGNIFQMFFAFGVGLVFGYITVRTGSMVYSILMHMFFNTLNTTVGQIALTVPQATAVLGVFILAAAVGGGVLLVLQRDRIRSHLIPGALPCGRCLLQGIKSVGFWLYLVLCLGLAVFVMLPY